VSGGAPIGVPGNHDSARGDVGRRARAGVTGVRGPVVASLTRQGDYPGHQHHQPDRDSRADQGGGETGQRLRDEGELGPVSDRLDHRIGVFRKTSRLIVTGKVHRDHLISALAQLRSNEMPVEGTVAGTVDKDLGRHQGVSLRCELKPVVRAHGALPSAVSLLELVVLAFGLPRAGEMGEDGRVPADAAWFLVPVRP
jgi:hypothetical protein